jgi:hypothetical protein
MAVRDLYNGFSYGMAHLLVYPLIALAIWILRPPMSALRVVGYATALMAVGSILLGLLMPSVGLLQTQFGVANLDKQIFGIGILVGPVGSANSLGHLLSLGAPAVLLIARRWLRWAAFAVIAFAVVWTASRNSMLSLGVLVAVALLLRGTATRLKVLGVLSIGVGIIAAVGLVPLLTTDPQAFANRGLVWRISFEAWVGNPAVGLGSNWYQAQLASSTGVSDSFVTGHNQFVHALTTGGIILALLQVFLCAVLLVNAGHAAVRGDRFPLLYTLPLLASFFFEVGLITSRMDGNYTVTLIPMAICLVASTSRSRGTDDVAVEAETLAAPGARGRDVVMA